MDHIEQFVSKAIPRIISQACDKNLPGALSSILLNHAKIASVAAMAGGFVPFVNAVAAPVIIVGATWHMYADIGEVLGVKFSENVLKSIATGVVTNLSSVMLVSFGINTLFSFVPFLSSVSSACITFVSLIVSGIIYLGIMDTLFTKDGVFADKSEAELKEIAEEIIKNQDIDSIIKDAKKVFKENQDNIKDMAKNKSK